MNISVASSPATIGAACPSAAPTNDDASAPAALAQATTTFSFAGSGSSEVRPSDNPTAKLSVDLGAGRGSAFGARLTVSRLHAAPCQLETRVVSEREGTQTRLKTHAHARAHRVTKVFSMVQGPRQSQQRTRVHQASTSTRVGGSAFRVRNEERGRSPGHGRCQGEHDRLPVHEIDCEHSPDPVAPSGAIVISVYCSPWTTGVYSGASAPAADTSGLRRGS